jgi:hypothetical protein
VRKLFRAVKHAAGTGWRVLWGLFLNGRLLISPAWVRHRRQLCHVCPKYAAKQDFCMECFCIVKIKTKLEEAKCPDDWW